MALHVLTENSSEPSQLSRHDGGVLAYPATESFQAIAVARTVGVAARTGIFAEAARGPATVTELASRLALQPVPLRMMLDLLVGQGLLGYRDGSYELSVSARRWLDPDSPTSVNTFLSHTLDYTDWWASLEQVVTGQPVGPPAVTADDDEVTWLRNVRGAYETARLLADDIADAMSLPTSARSVLDLGGSHGWYSAVLCQRNPALRATVIDRPGAVMIGREIMWETEMDRVVSHEAGDLYTADLGGPHDAVLYTPMMFDRDEHRTHLLLARIRRTLPIGGVLAVLRTHQGEARQHADQPPPPAALELLLYLRSGGERMSAVELDAALLESGFGTSAKHRLPIAPNVTLHLARAI
jgi:hypothetical protein